MLKVSDGCPKFLACLSWLLLVSATSVHSKSTSRSLYQADGSRYGDFKVVKDSRRRPFLALKDPTNAASDDIQRLYEQSGQISAIAYLLFAAAMAFSQAEGSSNALLPYLTPTLLRVYTSQPGRCSSSLARQLYELSQSLYGTTDMQACHYDLYIALDSTFSWLRDHIPLRLQEVPGQPLASALWPDMSLHSPSNLTTAVTAALSGPDKPLGDTAALLNISCGLAAADFAALVPNVSVVLQRLHVDLPLLQRLAQEVHAPRWSPEYNLTGSGHRRAMLQERKDLNMNSGPGSDNEPMLRDHAGRRRRSLLELPSNFTYSFPPSNFVIVTPDTMPRLMIPLVFHVMLYQDSESVGPAQYDQSPLYLQRMVKVANIMAKPSNIQFFIKEVRNDPTAYPYLLLPDRATWLQMPAQNCTGSLCFSNYTFMYNTVWDYPRSVNIYIASDSTVGVPLGYAYIGGSDVNPDSGHVFVSWDSLSFDGSNSLSLYDDGPNTLLHELFHHLGLAHTFDSSVGSNGQCVDADYVIDTPASLHPASSSSFFATATSYCMELFWGQYGGDWEATYARWSSTLGIPETDMNAWADSCPALAGYDELGNYMTYNTPVCFAALGHFTPAQVQRAHYMTSELNPVMYAWGQYYAQNAAPPPPQVSPPPAPVNNTCRNTAKSACACKSEWQLNGNTYSYCDRTGSSTNNLVCEVADPTTCTDCSDTPCILACAGTARICKRPPAPSTKMPPPPPPRPPSPPPMPPPPPPHATPSECKKTRSGCDCRSTWNYYGQYYGYCASPDGDPTLWCQVSSTCSSFNNDKPYQYCSYDLSESYCGGRVYFTTTRVPPAPPPDVHPRPPPSPPSPPVGPVATVSGQLTINASCALISTNLTDLQGSLLTELGQALQVPTSYITITSLKCGSIVVDYLVSFPTGVSPAQVDSVAATANSLSSASFSSSFTARWGSITQASFTGVAVLQPSAICSVSSARSVYCPSPPSPPPPPTSSKRIPWVRVGTITGGVVVAVIAVVVTIIIYMRSKNRRFRISPHLQAPVAGDPIQPPPTGEMGAMPGQPPYPTPQYTPPQYAQSQYPQPQYAQMQYPQPQYPQPPYRQDVYVQSQT